MFVWRKFRKFLGRYQLEERETNFNTRRYKHTQGPHCLFEMILTKMRLPRELEIDYFHLLGRPVHTSEDMAALPGAPALPLPAQTYVLLNLIFADAERDSTKGNSREKSEAFGDNTHTVAQHVTSLYLRQMMTTPTTVLDKPEGYVIISNGVGRMYTTLMHWMNTLANRDTTLHNKIFALEG